MFQNRPNRWSLIHHAKTMANYTCEIKPLACCLLNRFVRRNRRLPYALGWISGETNKNQWTTTSKHRSMHVCIGCGRWVVTPYIELARRTWTWLCSFAKLMRHSSGSSCMRSFSEVNVVAVTGLTRAQLYIWLNPETFREDIGTMELYLIDPAGRKKRNPCISAILSSLESLDYSKIYMYAC